MLFGSSPKKSQIHPHHLPLQHACRAAMIRMTVLLLALLAIQGWASEAAGMPPPIRQGAISSSSSFLRFVQDMDDPSRQIRRRKMQQENLGEDAVFNSTDVDAGEDGTVGEDGEGGGDLFYYPISLEYVVAVAGPTKGLPLPLIRDKQTWLNDAVDVMVQEEITELEGRRRRKLFRGRQLQTSTNILFITSAQVVDWSLLSSSSCLASSAWTCWKVQQSLSIQQQEISLTSTRPVDQTGPSFGRTMLDWKERDVTLNSERLEEGLKARILQQFVAQDDADSTTSTTVSLEFQDLLRDTAPGDISAVSSLVSDGDTISLLGDEDDDDSNEKMKAWAIVLMVLAILLCLIGLCYGCDRYTASTSSEGPTTTQRLRAGLQKAAQMVTRNPQYDQNTKAVNMAGEILEADNNVMDDVSSEDDSMVADMRNRGIEK